MTLAVRIIRVPKPRVLEPNVSNNIFSGIVSYCIERSPTTKFDSRILTKGYSEGVERTSKGPTGTYINFTSLHWIVFFQNPKPMFFAWLCFLKSQPNADVRDINWPPLLCSCYLHSFIFTQYNYIALINYLQSSMFFKVVFTMTL